jgi:hypothetical protein
LVTLALTDEADLPHYRLITGPDDADFCGRVSALVDAGYELHGSPAITADVGGKGHRCTGPDPPTGGAAAIRIGRRGRRAARRQASTRPNEFKVRRDGHVSAVHDVRHSRGWSWWTR